MPADQPAPTLHEQSVRLGHLRGLPRRPLHNAVRRAEVRDIGTPPRDPAQNVHLPRVRERVCQLIRGHLEERVGKQVLVVIDIGFNLDPLGVSGGGMVVFVKRKLDVGFTELDLLVAAGSSRVENGGSGFGRKRALVGRLDYLVHQFRIGPREESVLRHGVVPDEFLDVIERRAVGELNLRHRRGQVEEASQNRFFFHQIALARRRGVLFRPIRGTATITVHVVSVTGVSQEEPGANDWSLLRHRRLTTRPALTTPWQGIYPM